MNRVIRLARVLPLVGLSVVLLVLFGVNASAAHRRRHHRHKSATPSATPTIALRPLVLIVGGTGTAETTTGESPAVLESAEIYDCASRRFLPISSMTAHRDHHAATALANGKVLIVGGIDTVFEPSITFMGAAPPWLLPSTELFDPSTGVFNAGPNMAAPRDEPSATLLGNGRVLVVGGGTNSAELYDPSSLKFTATGDMAASRYGQTATLLRDGHVLIVGGGPQTAELYIPRTGKFRPSGKLSSNRIFQRDFAT